MSAYTYTELHDLPSAQLGRRRGYRWHGYVGISIGATLLLTGVYFYTNRSNSGPAATVARATPGVVASLGRRPTHNRLYHAEVVSASAVAVGVTQSWIVHVSRRGNRRLANARIALTTRAPESDEASPLTPTAHYIGGGDYRVDDIAFPHSGWWNVALVIRGAAGTDSVAFNVILPSTLATGSAPVAGCGVERANQHDRATVSAPKSSSASSSAARRLARVTDAGSSWHVSTHSETPSC